MGRNTDSVRRQPYLWEFFMCMATLFSSISVPIENKNLVYCSQIFTLPKTTFDWCALMHSMPWPSSN